VIPADFWSGTDRKSAVAAKVNGDTKAGYVGATIVAVLPDWQHAADATTGRGVVG
jgi:hypothetical protein